MKKWIFDVPNLGERTLVPGKKNGPHDVVI
jgi:hypothetical protein